MGSTLAPRIPARVDFTSDRAGIAIILLAVLVFLVYSRVPEVIGVYIGSLHLPMILMVVLSCWCLIAGWPAKTFLSLPGMAQLAFTIWLFCCIPTSVWPGGSFQTITNDWLASFVIFFVTASVVSTVNDSSRLARSMALGVVAIFVTYLLFGKHLGYRVETAIGTMGNPNLFALQLLMGMPFCLYVVYRSGIFSWKGAFYLVMLFVTLSLVVETGSRSGLIALAIGYVIILLRASVLGKAGLIAMAGLGLLAAGAVLPHVTLLRYLTMFSNDRSRAEGDLEIMSAMDSADARRHHLEQSIQLTMQHPVFGVGPGQFKVAAADLSQKSQAAAAWLETHNSWTQVSSETGFPGILMYAGAILYCMKRLWSQYRIARKNPRLFEIADLTFCLLTSFIITIVTMTFASAAYQPGMPLLCGLAVGLFRVSENAIQEAKQTPNAVPVEPLSPIAWNNQVNLRPRQTPAYQAPEKPYSSFL